MFEYCSTVSNLAQVRSLYVAVVQSVEYFAVDSSGYFVYEYSSRINFSVAGCFPGKPK